MNTAAKPKIAFGEGEMRRHVRQRHQRPHRHFAGGDAGRPVRRHVPPTGTLATIGSDQPVTLVACAFGGDQCHMPVILMDMGNVLGNACDPPGGIQRLLDQPGESSLLQSKQVTFVGGKPQTSNYLDDYPFPFYVVLEDIRSLPEVLADALRQWYEVMARTGDR